MKTKEIVGLGVTGFILSVVHVLLLLGGHITYLPGTPHAETWYMIGRIAIWPLIGLASLVPDPYPTPTIVGLIVFLSNSLLWGYGLTFIFWGLFRFLVRKVGKKKETRELGLK